MENEIKNVSGGMGEWTVSVQVSLSHTHEIHILHKPLDNIFMLLDWVVCTVFVDIIWFCLSRLFWKFLLSHYQCVILIQLLFNPSMQLFLMLITFINKIKLERQIQKQFFPMVLLILMHLIDLQLILKYWFRRRPKNFMFVSHRILLLTWMPKTLTMYFWTQ